MRKKQVKNSFLIIALFIILAGCGLKGNPSPFHAAVSDKKPVITNMKALSAGKDVLVQWNFRDKSGLINRIGIDRSELGTPGNECKDCPRTFKRIGQIQVKTGMPADKEQETLSFTDTTAIKGNIYNYRLMLCEENGNCSEAATAEIHF